MSEEKKYIDADDFIRSIRNIANPGFVYIHTNSQLDREINQLIQNALTSAFSSLINQLENAAKQSSKPYSQCMLCTRKPHDPDPSAES